MNKKVLRVMNQWVMWGLGILLTSAVYAQDIGPKVLTRKQYHPELAVAQTVLIQAQAFKDSREVDSTPILRVLLRRMRALDYTVTTHPSKKHDVVIHVSCDEPVNLMRRDSVPHQIDSHAIPPPCLLHYIFNGKQKDWQRVDRIVFNEGVSAAQRAAGNIDSARPLPFSTEYLEQYEYPLLLTAEWNQVSRLVTFLDAPKTEVPRKHKIISLLGEIRAEEAFSCIVDALDHEALAEGATFALGNFGGKAQPYLVNLLTTSPQAEIQAAAAHSLGQVGAMTGDTSLTPLLLQVLTSPGTDMTVQTEIVWALGKAPDFQSFATLEQLEEQIWLIRSDDPQLQRLREAVDWSIREVRQGGHTDEYE